MSQNYSQIVMRLQELEKEVLRLSANSTGNDLGILFTIKDTEFLLGIIAQSNIPADRLKSAQETIEKIKGLHAILMEKGVSV